MKGKIVSHTPGPWAVDYVFNDHEPDVILGYDTPGEGSPIIIATVFADSDRYPNPFIDLKQAKANARLMAAAPDLLQALEYVKIYGSHGEIEEGEHKGQSVSFFIDTAIVKAKGGSR